MLRTSKNKRYMQQVHIDYILKYGHQLTIFQLAEVTGFSTCCIHQWCVKLKVKMTKSYFQPEGFVVPPLIQAEEIKPVIIATGTRYDNKSRDERINELLKMEI